MNRRRIYSLLFLLFLLSLAMRLIHIGQESFFIDEVLVARSCSQPTWHYVEAVETSPPLYFYVIKLWSGVFGLNHVSLRVFSALCGAVGVLLFYAVARELGLSTGWRFLSGILLALSPMAFWYDQQARHYALLCLLVTAWMLFFLRVRRRGATVDQVVLGLVLLAGFSTHYYFAFAVIGGLVLAGANLLIAPGDKRLWKLCLTHGLVCLSWLFYLPLLKKQLSFSHIEWNTRPEASDFLDVFFDIFPGGPFSSVPFSLQVGIGVLFLLAAAALVHYLFTSKSRANPEANYRLFRGLFLALSVLLSVLLPILISIYLKPIFNKERYSIIALPAYYLFIAYAFNLLRKPLLRVGAYSLVVILFLPSGLYFICNYWSRYQDFDWRGAIRLVESEWKPGDAMVFSPGWMKASYTDNGGETKKVLSTVQVGDPNRRGTKRLWLFDWKQNPSKKDKQIVRALRKTSKDCVRVDFPHIKLIQIRLRSVEKEN